MRLAIANSLCGHKKASYMIKLIEIYYTHSL